MLFSSRSFRWRGFVTCSLALSFLLAAASGVVLFMRPEGSLARWVGWTVLGAGKAQWEALHIGSVALLVAMSPFHLWFNWRPLAAAVADHLGRAWVRMARPRRELAAAAALVALVTWGSLAGWQPFAAADDLRASIKDGRFVVTTPPPAANADRMTVRELCDRIDLAPAEATGNARRRGIVIGDPSRTLGGIAEELGLSPEEVFEALAAGHERPVQP
jgi:hypothetical protein